MVPATGTPVRARQLRLLNSPQAVAVRAGAGGAPLCVHTGGELRGVAAIRNRWRVDDGWWDTPISRMYFELELEGGSLVTLYHDLSTDNWYRQRYGVPDGYGTEW